MLRKKISHEAKNHTKESKRILKENVLLIQEVNVLKFEAHKVRCLIKEQGGVIPEDNATGKPPSGNPRVRAMSARHMLGQKIRTVKLDIRQQDQDIEELTK